MHSIHKNLFIFFIASLALISCNENSQKNKNTKSQAQSKNSKPKARKAYSPPPVQVEIQKIKKKNLQIKVDVVGTTLPYRRALLSSAISGKIIKINIAEGKIIQKGKPLVQVETYSWKAKVREKKAECKRWHAEIDKLKNGYLEEEIDKAKASLKEKEASLKRIDVEKTRVKNLLSQQGISQSEWDEVRYSHEAMEAQVGQMRADLARMLKGYRSEDLDIAKAHLESAEAQLSQVENNLKKTTILAPFTGVISKKHVEIGEWLSEGKVVAELVDFSKAKVEISVAEKYISLVRLNMKANIKLDAFPGQKITGIVSEIIPKTEGFARNFPVRLLVNNPDRKIMEGMFCRVQGILREEQNVFMVHRDAFMHKNGDISIAKVSADNTVEIIRITLGVREGEWFEIISPKDFKDGDKVVVTNNNKVYPGAKVIITNTIN